MAESPLCAGRSNFTHSGGGLVAADVVVLGSVRAGRALLRSGAHPGDIVYVTGALGGAAAELRALAERPAAFRKKDSAAHPHLYPQPRVAAGRRLVRHISPPRPST